MTGPFGFRHGTGQGLMRRVTSVTPKYVKRACWLTLIGAIGMFGHMWLMGEDEKGYPGRALLETRICNGDTLLPLIPYENTWDINRRAILYLLFLGWLFLGVAISADCFMAAIEVITSQTETVVVNGENVELEVWNSTVANLTLMALGSSAPEILLAVVETVSLKFESGDLGPGTIVGSAAFNLLFITAICISCLPFEKNSDGEEDETRMETRRIEEFGVFGITAVASLFAYFWMVIVLDFWTKDQVTIIEALLTLFMFPALVWVSWAEDNKWWGYLDSLFAAQVTPGSEGEEHHAHRPRLKSISTEGGMVRRVSQAAHAIANADVEDPKKLAEQLAAEAMRKKKKSRLAYRIQATRRMAGGKRIMPGAGKKDSQLSEEEAAAAEPTTATLDFGVPAEGPPKIWDAKSTGTEVRVEEACGICPVIVKRGGADQDKTVTVQFDTSDGDAVAGTDYVKANGTLTFGPGVLEQTIPITVIDDNEWGPDQHLYVRIFGAKLDDKDEGVTIGAGNCKVVILNDDEPGVLSFTSQTVTAKSHAEQVTLTIQREHGNSGNVLAFLKTMDGTAKAGQDFTALDEEGVEKPEGEHPTNEIHFEHQQATADVVIDLMKNDSGDKTFTVELVSVEPEGAKIGETSKCTVIISDSHEYEELMKEVVTMMDKEMEDYSVGTSSWAEQFHEAMNMGGEDGGDPEFADYLMHFLSFYWKVLHAIVPPTDYWGGWGTFWVSLGMIGAITCLVGDTAKMLGCVIGLDDSITAITFVALGTSLPDTFASMEATAQDETADAAITNVTGSNSVNVFLGLGLPWCMAAFYHAAEDTPGGYKYPAGDLVFSVLVFFAFAVACIALLIIRRFYFEAELGGNVPFAYFSSAFLAGSWFMYVIISALKTKGKIG